MCVCASLAVWIVVAWSTTCLIAPLLPPPVLLLLSSRQLTLVASAAPTRWPCLCSPLLNLSTALASPKCPGDQIKQTFKTSLQLVQSHVNRTSLAALASALLTFMWFLVNCCTHVRCFACVLGFLLQVLIWAWSHWAVNRAGKGPSSHQLRVSVNSNPVTIIHSIMTDGYDRKITLPDVCDAFFYYAGHDPIKWK
jgi:hypothetical protein